MASCSGLPSQGIQCQVGLVPGGAAAELRAAVTEGRLYRPFRRLPPAKGAGPDPNHPDPPHALSFRALRLGLITLLIVLGTALSAGWAMHQAKRQAMEDDAQRASQQLGLYANALHTLIDRYRALPAVLALDPELIAALRGRSERCRTP
jgi:hypothetical protein